MGLGNENPSYYPKNHFFFLEISYDKNSFNKCQFKARPKLINMPILNSNVDIKGYKFVKIAFA